MKPKPQVSPKKSVKLHKQPKQASLFKAVTLAVLLITGGGWAFQTLFEHGHTSSSSPAVGIHAADNLSAQQVQQRQQSFKQHSTGFFLQQLNAAQLQAKLNQSNGIDPTSKAVLSEGLHDGRYTKFVELTVWDDVAEDGDIVQIQSLDHAETVMLTHLPKTIYFPVQDGLPISLTGIKDGGGGITLGFTGSSQAVSLPVLAEGDRIELWLQ